LVENAAERSYGLNVARLADLPNEIIVKAKLKSREMEESIHQKDNQNPIKEKRFFFFFQIK